MSLGSASASIAVVLCVLIACLICFVFGVWLQRDAGANALMMYFRALAKRGVDKKLLVEELVGLARAPKK